MIQHYYLLGGSGANNTTQDLALPSGQTIDWIQIALTATQNSGFTPNILCRAFLSFSPERHHITEFAHIAIGMCRPAATDISTPLSEVLMMGPGLNILIPEGASTYLHVENEAGTTSYTDLTLCFFLPKPGHVSRFTRPKISVPHLKLRSPGGRELNKEVVTLFGAREAALDGLGQLLYGGELILKNYDLWSGEPEFKSVPGRGIFPTAPPEMDATQLLELMDGYFGQGVDYLKDKLTRFGRLRPHEALWKELANDPISTVVAELLARALPQTKPRQWITAHFRSRSVAGVLERNP